MAENYLITGYWGEPHVTAENDRGINAGIFGAGRFVLPVGEKFKAEYIGNNTIRLYDGKLMDNGAAAGIPAGEYVDILIANASQGMKRNDLIVFQYEQDASTMIESGRFVVVQGKEASGTPTDPTLTQGDLLSGEAVIDQMPLWRVSVSGGTISAPVRVAEIAYKFRVGQWYFSDDPTSPAELYGGTWEQVKDRFPLGAGDKYALGATGGSADAVVVSHHHTFTAKYGVGTGSGSSAPPWTATGGTENSGITHVAGEDGTGKNMPPYRATYIWRRVA